MSDISYLFEEGALVDFEIDELSNLYAVRPVIWQSGESPQQWRRDETKDMSDYRDVSVRRGCNGNDVRGISHSNTDTEGLTETVVQGQDCWVQSKQVQTQVFAKAEHAVQTLDDILRRLWKTVCVAANGVSTGGDQQLAVGADVDRSDQNEIEHSRQGQ